MDIKSALDKEHSKQLTTKIVDYIGSDKKKYKEIIQLVLGEDPKLAQRASWVLGTIADEHPSLIIPHIEKLLTHFNNPIHNGIKRNTMRALSLVAIPKKNQGMLVDIAFDLLLDHQTPVAISIHAMTILHEITKEETDLQRELILVIEDFMKKGSAGVKSRGNKILNDLRK